MKLFIRYILIGIQYFLTQTLFEVFIIIVLLYLGMPYFGMGVGNEEFLEIIVGVFGYWAFTKAIYYGWIYILLFSSLSVFSLKRTPLALSILNAFLSIFFILVMLSNGRTFKSILNPSIAIISASVLIIFIKVVSSKNRFIGSK